MDILRLLTISTQDFHVITFQHAEYPGLRIKKLTSDGRIGDNPFVPIGLQRAPANA